MELNDYPGKFCQEINLTKCRLLQNTVCEIPPETLRNGAVIELVRFAAKSKISQAKVGIWLCELQPCLKLTGTKSLQNRLTRVIDIQKKLDKKKRKVSSYTNVNEFQNEIFKVRSDNSSNTSENLTSHFPETEIRYEENSNQSLSIQTVPQTATSTIKTCSALTVSEIAFKDTLKFDENVHSTGDTEQRENNSLAYEIRKKQKTLQKISRLVEMEKETLERLKSVKGHFSVRNVTKRDENATNTRKKFCEASNHIVKLQRKITELEKVNQELKVSLDKTENENTSLQGTVTHLQNVEKQKINAQKLNSYFRREVKKLRESPHGKKATDEKWKKELKKKDDEIDYLQNERDELHDKLNEGTYQTKDEKGVFRDNVRQCIMELFSLEIATEKISDAIRAVGKHLFNSDLTKSDLPSPSTVQSIVDEGHFLAKAFIAEKVKASENIGLSRDGTTRRKEKIVDTAVTLDSGEIMSLGFTKIAKETAKTITEVTKNHFSELAETVTNINPKTENNTDFIRDSLEKLAFTMSDRASNEKLADKLLSEWRDSLLENCSEKDKSTVMHFHCMAHVLLGFHRYVCEDFKVLEKELVEKHGPIGRDSLPVFQKWSKKQTVIERVTCTTSAIFGPAGDHLGLRDRWDAYCATKGIRSLIGNYKDNRFNALFQTSAEVLHHMKDFLKVIETVDKPGLKIKAVEADLKSDICLLFLQAMAVIYVQITAPYWWLITSGSVTYLELAPYVKSLESYLEHCENSPMKMLDLNNQWFSNEDVIIPHLEKYEEVVRTIDHSELLLRLLKVVSGGMLRTVRKQLTDFLNNGKFSETPTKDDLRRTGFAQVTNLACEHHFGDLDSSQKRRPNATFHHHTSVQLLKRNRKKLFTWLSEVGDGNVMKIARKKGRELRKQHRLQEKNVNTEIMTSMESKQPTKRRKTKETLLNEENEPEEDYDIKIPMEELLPSQDDIFKMNEYVIVAYQDSWYPGCVEKCLSATKAIVSFMVPCRTAGSFIWPARKDIQEVEKQFVLKKGLVPECRNSGRQWVFKNYQEINQLYEMYKRNYF